MSTNHTGAITYQSQKKVMPESQWQAMTIEERLKTYPFLTEEQAKSLTAYIAIDKNRVNKILAYCHDIEHYARVVIKYPEQRLDMDERVLPLLPENQKQKKAKTVPPIMAASSSQPLAPGVKPGVPQGEKKEEVKKIEASKPKEDEPKQSSPRPQPEKQLGGGVKKVANKPKGKTPKQQEVQGNLF